MYIYIIIYGCEEYTSVFFNKYVVSDKNKTYLANANFHTLICLISHFVNFYALTTTQREPI